MRKAGRTLQLAFAAILAVAGLLAIFPSPNYELWAVSVVAGIYGHYFIAPALLMLLPPLRRGWTGRLALALAWTGAVTAGIPGLVVMLGGFGASSLSTLFLGDRTPAVQPRTYVYDSVHHLALDLYPAAEAAPVRPTVLVVHGGAWEGSDRREFPHLNSYLAARGHAVAAIDYRLAPRSTYPAQLDDVQAAIKYVQDNRSQLGIRSAELVLLGRSAGGHLALLAAYRAPPGTIKGVISLYAPTDLAFAYQHARNKAVIDGPALLREFLGASLEDKPEVYAQASPITLVRPGLPPTLLIHGLKDEQVSPAQPERLAAALRAAGDPVTLLELPLTNHAYDFNFSGAAAQVATQAIMTALEFPEGEVSKR